MARLLASPQLDSEPGSPILKLESLKRALPFQADHCLWGLLRVLQVTVEVVACGDFFRTQRRRLRTAGGPSPPRGVPSSSTSTLAGRTRKCNCSQGAEVLVEAVPPRHCQRQMAGLCIEGVKRPFTPPAPPS